MFRGLSLSIQLGENTPKLKVLETLRCYEVLEGEYTCRRCVCTLERLIHMAGETHACRILAGEMRDNAVDDGASLRGEAKRR